MKKKREVLFPHGDEMRLNFRKMKLTVILVFIVCVTFGNSFSQVRLSVNFNKTDIREVLQTIEEKTNYIFLYKDQIFDFSQKINAEFTDAKFEDVLKSFCDQTNTSYEIRDRQIILKEKSANPVTGEQAPQKRAIFGKVTDSSGGPLPGVSVVVKGTTIGTITDSDGKFSLQVPSDAKILSFSFVGMKSLEIPIAGTTSFNVVLEEEIVGIDEVVTVGYGTQKKGLLTGSVQTIKVSEALREIPSTSVGNLLAGQFAGVDVSTPSGVPGENPGISIRTTATWKNDQPITYVIDGVIRTESEFNDLGTNEIESITVLKDAAAAAVYGSRSAGGVILVTTKNGTVGKASVNYSFNTGFDTRTKGIPITNALQTAGMVNRFYAGTSQAAQYSQEEIDYLAGINNGWGYNQLDAIWKNPSTSQHNLSISGGSDKIKYFAAGSYTDQKSFIDVFNFKKYNARLNVTADITKDLQVFAGMSMATTTTSSGVFETPGAIYSKLLVWQPYQPVFTDGGKPIDYGWIANIGSYNSGENGYEKSYVLNPNLLLKATYKIPFVKGLSAIAAYSLNWNNNRNRNYLIENTLYLTKISGTYNKIISTSDADIVGTRTSSVFSTIGGEQLQESLAYSQDYQLNFQLNFDRTFNNLHHVQGLVVFEKAESADGGFNGTRYTIPFYKTDQWWAFSDVRENSSAGGSVYQTTGRMSYIGQFNYDFDRKYLLAFSFREDGSMNFAPDQRWGFFPAVSAGYVLSQEPYLNSVKWLDFLKIRGSVGMTGNDAVGGWQWQQSYITVKTNGIPVNNAYFGEIPAKNNGLTYGVLANPRLTWEKVLSYNAGMDINFLKHFSGTLEYWYKKSYDILDQRIASYPTTFSLTIPDENYGRMDAQGFDFTLGYDNHSGEFKYNVKLNVSYGWNKIVQKDYASNAKPIDVPTGTSTTRITGFVFDRIIRTQEDLDNFSAQYPGYKYKGIVPALGMMVYKDLSGPDGTPDGLIDDWDRVVLFKNNFPVIYGLSAGFDWKGFSLDMMFNGKLFYQKSFQSIADFAANNRCYVGWYDNSWTADNTTAWLPKPEAANKTRTYVSPANSAFWYKDASFIRLKYIKLSYDIPSNLYSNVVPIKNAKLFFTGTNLFYFSKFNLYDPEMTSGTQDYPIMRTFNFGLNVSF